MPQPSIAMTQCNKLLIKRMHFLPGFYYFAVTGSALFIILPVMLISFNILPILDDYHQRQYLHHSSFYLLFLTIHIFFWSRLATKTTILPTHLVLFPLSDINKFRMLIRISLSDYRIILHFIFVLVSTLLIGRENIIAGILALVICAIFSFSIELLLFNILLLMLTVTKLPIKREIFLVILMVLPAVALSFPHSKLTVENLPITSWASKALMSAQIAVWDEFVIWTFVLGIVVFFEILLGIYFIRKSKINFMV